MISRFFVNLSKRFDTAMDCDVAPGHVYLFFLISAGLVFSNFILQFKVVVGSTDQFFGHYPNLIYGYRALRSGSLGLWNPFIFAGTDFTASMHNHMLNPINWVLLPFPEKYIFHALTLRCLLEVSLIGYLTFRICSLYLGKTWGALFCAVVAQLGGFTWFTMITFIATHLLMISIFSIYLILTMDTRRPVANIVLLILCFADILLVGHIGYMSAFSLPVMVTFLAKIWSPSPTRSRMEAVAIVLGAALFGMTVAAVRLWPIMHELLYEGVVIPNLGLPSQMGNCGYFALSAFIPEAFGLHLSDSQAIFTLLNVPGRHIAFHNLVYGGIVPTLLVYLGLLRSFRFRTFIFSLLFVVVANGPLFVIQPISDIMNIICFPVIHEIIQKTLTSFLFVAALASAVYDLSNGEIEEPKLRSFIVVIGVVLTAYLAMGTKVLHVRPESSRFEPWIFRGFQLAMIGVLTGTLTMAMKLRLDAGTARRLTNTAVILFGIAVLAAALTAARMELFSHWLVIRDFAYTLGAVIWAVGVISYMRHREVNNRGSRSYLWMAQVTIALLILIIPWSETSGPRTLITGILAGFLSSFKFLALSFVALEILASWGSKRILRTQLFSLLTFLTLGELLFFTKLYSTAGTSPFVKASALYPEHTLPGQGSDIDAWHQSPSLPNLLQNYQLTGSSHGIPGWAIGGGEPQIVSAAVSKGFGAITIHYPVDGTLFQDKTLPDKPKSVAFGAWVKSKQGQKVFVFITSGGVGGAPSASYAGGGQWEWLSARFDDARGLGSVRPHVAMAGPGEMTIFGPRLVGGPIVTPSIMPEGAVHPTEALRVLHEPPPRFDLHQFRMNNPNRMVGLHESTLCSIPMVYNIPTYGGNDSDLSKDFTDFVSAFEPGNSSVFRIGIIPRLTNSRLLDILGVKYDCTHGLEVRPNALARFSFYSDFEILDVPHMVERLKQASFDPTRTILIDRDPGWGVDPKQVAPKFQPVEFRSPSSIQLEAEMDISKPGILLFNDRYSRYWRASFNGTALPIMRANAIFMAVSVPRGRGHLTCEFVPTEFLRLARISIFIVSILGLLGLYIGLTGGIWKATPRAIP